MRFCGYLRNEVKGIETEYVIVVTDNSTSWDNGTYVVKNGYIVCTNDIGGVIEVPYTYENGTVKIDSIAAFDFSIKVLRIAGSRLIRVPFENSGFE